MRCVISELLKNVSRDLFLSRLIGLASPIVLVCVLGRVNQSAAD
jgi:hypothetical protein